MPELPLVITAVAIVVLVLLVLWWGAARRRFPGPPTGVLSMHRLEEIAAEERAVHQQPVV